MTSFLDPDSLWPRLSFSFPTVESLPNLGEAGRHNKSGAGDLEEGIPCLGKGSGEGEAASRKSSYQAVTALSFGQHLDNMNVYEACPKL